MKKTNIIFSSLVIIGLSLVFTITSCNNGLTYISDMPDTTSEIESENTETGSATLSIVIPAYYAMANIASENQRAIAPQTTKIKLSYKKFTKNNYGFYNSEWVTIKTIGLSSAEKALIQDAPQGFVGSVYKYVFTDIPSGIYLPAYLKVELLDASNTPVSSGTNSEKVIVTMGQNTQTTFYTLPSNLQTNDNQPKTIQAGKMIFFEQIFDSELSTSLMISVSEGNKYPDLVIFNNQGMFEKYCSFSENNNAIDCSEYKGTKKYFGFWAPYATTFTLQLSYDISEAEKAAYAINQDFEAEIDTTKWVAEGACAKIVDYKQAFTRWDHCADELPDTHNKIFKLGMKEGSSSETSSLTIKEVRVFEPSALSFDYKCDIYSYSDLEVYIDDAESPVFSKRGTNNIWQKASINLSTGTHTIKFQVPYSGYTYNEFTNAAYLDNITLAPNETESVAIYPKGLQETYVNGNTIKFKAKALRSDGSVINGKTVTWQASSGTIDADGLFTPGDTAGSVTISATIDGKTASKTTVKVHGQNYLSDPVTINGHTFTGTITPGSGTVKTSSKITLEAPTPGTQSFTADGFFVLKGHADDTYVYVRILKGTYETEYIIPPGDFEQRIWLRFGEGEHKIYVAEATVTFADNYDGYEGAVRNLSTAISGTATFIANNQTTLKNELGNKYTDSECSLLMPSFIIQSDDFIVSNLFNAIMAELPSDATTGQKLAAIHNWEIHNLYYDNLSATDKMKRKKQDAVSVIKYGTAVCEGYANLFAALSRHLGILTAYQSSMTMVHAWIECYYDREWKLVDVTWDDPISDESIYNTENNPISENYKYFLIGLTGIGNDHKGNVTDYGRSAEASTKIIEPCPNILIEKCALF